MPESVSRSVVAIERKYAREVRVAVLALVPVVLATPAAGAGGAPWKVAFLDRASWGATSFAWGRNGALALGRSVCHVPCGVPLHQEVWIRRGGSLRRVAGPLRGVQLPRVAAVAGDGRALWWSDLQDSASIAADGLPLYADRTHVADTLVYPDYVSVCGGHLAVAQGGDRHAMHGKHIVFDGRDDSRDPSRS